MDVPTLDDIMSADSCDKIKELKTKLHDRLDELGYPVTHRSQNRERDRRLARCPRGRISKAEEIELIEIAFYVASVSEVDRAEARARLRRNIKAIACTTEVNKVFMEAWEIGTIITWARERKRELCGTPQGPLPPGPIVPHDNLLNEMLDRLGGG